MAIHNFAAAWMTDEHQMLFDTASRFFKEQWAPKDEAWRQAGMMDRSAWEEAGANGFLCASMPEEYGGAGGDFGHEAVLILAQGTAGISGFGGSLHSGIVAPYILHHGTEEQKKRWLSRLATGELIGAIAMTEPGTGSDLQAVRTTAVREGDEYVLDGSKCFISGAGSTDVLIVMARTGEDGAKGISCFLVPTATPGYSVARVERKMGQHASDTCQIVFDNCRVPASALLGKEGEGYKIALSNLEAGRIGIAAQSIGMARAAFEAAVRYAKERVTFGVPIIEHQAVNFRLADMNTLLDAARLMVWRAATLKDAGKPCLKEASMAKMFASEAAEKIASDAIQIHGGVGYTSDFPVERIYRDVRICQIYEGANDIQRLVIGRSIAAE